MQGLGTRSFQLQSRWQIEVGYRAAMNDTTSVEGYELDR